jgi:hypothetical protein
LLAIDSLWEHQNAGVLSLRDQAHQLGVLLCGGNISPIIVRPGVFRKILRKKQLQQKAKRAVSPRMGHLFLKKRTFTISWIQFLTFFKKSTKFEPGSY